jgi:hypothetical protein
MKRLSIVFLALPVLLLTPQLPAAVVTVTSNPLWTDTGVTLVPSDVVDISGASGLWNWGTWPSFGPDGNYNPTFAWDEWITNGYHGQLIGYVGSVVDPNINHSLIPQNDPSLFVIGTGAVSRSGVSGKLWLGFNDDYASYAIGDNSGSVTVNVIPEPASLAVWSVIVGLSMAGAYWRRRRKPAA